MIGKSLDNASKAYEVGDGHVKRFKRNLDSTLKLDKQFQIDVQEETLLEE